MPNEDIEGPTWQYEFFGSDDAEDWVDDEDEEDYEGDE